MFIEISFFSYHDSTSGRGCGQWIEREHHSLFAGHHHDTSFSIQLRTGLISRHRSATCHSGQPSPQTLYYAQNSNINWLLYKNIFKFVIFILWNRFIEFGTYPIKMNNHICFLTFYLKLLWQLSDKFFPFQIWQEIITYYYFDSSPLPFCGIARHNPLLRQCN
jgi:hypothetical protein